MGDSPFKLLATREVYANRWLSVREDRVVRPGGSEGIFGVITMKAGSSVLPVTPNGEVHLTREFKYGIDAYSIEAVSGAIEEGESPQEAAARELQEELGMTAADWVDLGVVDPFTTVVKSPNYLFVARNALQTHETALDEGEVLTRFTITLNEAIALVEKSSITHSATCVLILKAARLLGV
jgi:ADP-ribose pyrophosphatase